MHTKFQKHINGFASFSDEELGKILETVKPKRLWKRQVFLHEGQVCQHLIWISKGVLRLYFMDRLGKEHTIEFGLETNFLTDRHSLSQNIPSIYQIDALCDTEVLLISRESLLELTNQIPNFGELLRIITLQALENYQNRILATLTLSADEKYRMLFKQNPVLLQQVPQHMIASYLGITPATLSRIRKNYDKDPGAKLS
jgi:CRP-like cAMP-binding protein